jgi:hypothetical protein
MIPRPDAGCARLSTSVAERRYQERPQPTTSSKTGEQRRSTATLCCEGTGCCWAAVDRFGCVVVLVVLVAVVAANSNVFWESHHREESC